MSLNRAARRRAAKSRPKDAEDTHTPDVITPKPYDWAALRREGQRMAEEHRRAGDYVTDRGRPVTVKILAPKEVRGGDKFQLSAVKIELDWKMAIKLKILEEARDIITGSTMLGSLDPALTSILVSVIEERGLYEHNIGEFFLLYGRFEQKHGVSKGPETRKKMEELIQGEQKFLKPYKEYGQENLVPLPYAVRNILSHAKNPNTLDRDGEELRTSIGLLKTWLKQ